jgi:hypothetical protein
LRGQPRRSEHVDQLIAQPAMRGHRLVALMPEQADRAIGRFESTLASQLFSL